MRSHPKCLRWLLCASVSISVSACGDNNSETSNSYYYGLWQHTGYGDIYRLNENKAQIYQFNSEGCLIAESMSPETMKQKYFPGATLSSDNMTITSQGAGHPFTSTYERLFFLPDICQSQNLLDKSSSPVRVYNFFWANMNDYYAFFSERGVDWNEVYQQAQTRLSDDMTDEALFEVIQTSLSGFSDDHIFLSSGDDSFSPAAPKGVLQVLIQGFLNQTQFTTVEAYAADALTKITAIQQQMMDSGSVHVIHGATTDPIYGTERMVWGTFNQGSIGYFRPNVMQLELSETDTDSEQLVNHVVSAMDQVMQDLTDTDAIIIDMRFNGGGEDGASQEIASRFNAAKQQVLGRFTRTITGEGDLYWIDLPESSRTTAYTKPVMILTSGSTVSAGETFMIMMKSLPQVTIMGESTSGSLSDALHKTLPNGWEMSLSNEVYIDPQYQAYEVTGVPPDIAIVPFRLSDITENKDTALSAAIVRAEAM
ncbi:Peptidase family S41 [Vibrio aerogenes CECT 7868]|uniref:Peptidase family S41 n=1 Tax=Vibrio aerogenes CECT 7868 TaxID=1216006 RepID=A0A1M5Y199_9VIBR|nr:S41 family peptidase [Vibrio aerogenes]SHI05594.1 Peptidase family S41 [Vibrio aerogenes CECT 7868]